MYEDIVQLEWLSIFVEHCSEGRDLTMSKDQISKSSSSSSSKDLSQQFQTSSPVSVLESSSSSCSAENKPAPPPSPEAVNPARCGRARSKRPRPATFNPRPAIQLAPQQSSDIAENEPSAGNCEESDYPLVVKVPKRQADGAEPKKKKKIKFTMPSAPPAEADRGLPSAQQAVRKCLHCEITKTPQWRAGPLGPKTLCNACGVRYKSGRLFPEYRPAASPTFIPSLHSNSHKKVLEMRSKPTDEADATGTASALTGSLDLIPNMSHRLDYM